MSTTAGKKNLVVITSAIKSLTSDSVFSPEVRYLQLLRTLLTAIEKVPNPYIVVLDTGTMTEAQEYMIKIYANEFFSMNVSQFTKNGGEMAMLYLYFVSESFKKILPTISTINKLSGRYYLTDRFDFNKFDSTKNVIRLRDRKTENIPPYFDTRFFRIPVERFAKFWEKYNNYMTTSTQQSINMCSVENLYYNNKFFEAEDCEHDTHIGVGGFFACTGGYQED